MQTHVLRVAANVGDHHQRLIDHPPNCTFRSRSQPWVSSETAPPRLSRCPLEWCEHPERIVSAPTPRLLLRSHSLERLAQRSRRGKPVFPTAGALCPFPLILDLPCELGAPHLQLVLGRVVWRSPEVLDAM